MSLGAFVQFVVAFTDSYFVARIDPEAMSAVSYVGLIYITLAMIGHGLANGAQIIVARRKGEGNLDAAGETSATSLKIGLLAATIQFILLAFCAPLILHHVIESKEVLDYMNAFIPFRAAGFFFYTTMVLLNAFWSGTARTRVIAYTTFITASVNIVLDYLLIFGHAGLPEMGVKGAALATMLAESAACAYLIVYTLRHKESRDYRLLHHLVRPTLTYTKSLIRLSGPIILQLLVSLGIWVVFYNFVEKLGEKSFQSSFIVRNMYMLAWVSVTGTATTTKTYVSGLIAEGRQKDLIPTIKRLALLSLAGVVLLTHGLIFYPTHIAGLFTTDPETIRLTVLSMWFVFPAILIFSQTSILLSMVEGSGNTLAGFIIEALTTLFYITAAYFFAAEWRWPVYLVWTSDYIYFILLGVFSLIFLRTGKWRHTRV